MKIGIVDLDTSHPGKWVPIERELGHDVVGVWDGGSVHPGTYVSEFARTHGIPRIYQSLEEMAEDVDCAIIHSCDWDTHVAKAAPFIQAGKAVFIDKPQGGNVKDLDQLCQWAREGATITGGSAMMYHAAVDEYLAKPVEERGEPHTVFCGCAVDEFNYGVHAYSLACHLFGPGAVSVRHLGKRVQRRVQVNWADGRMAVVVIGSARSWTPFHATIVTDRGFEHLAQTGNLYRDLLKAVLPHLAGEVATPPVDMEASIEPELCALAARTSWLADDREVRLAEVRNSEVAYDGAEFARFYRRKQYPGGS